MSYFALTFVMLLFTVASGTGLFFLLRKWKVILPSTFGVILKSALTLLLVILLGGFATGTVLNFDGYLERERPKLETDLDGFKIGWDVDELIFRKGEPSSKKQKDKDLQEWAYSSDIAVGVEKNKILYVMQACDNSSYYRRLGNIYCHDSIDKVVDKYGEADISTSKNKLWRSYNYKKYSIAFAATGGKVQLFVVFDPTTKGYGFNE